MYDSSLTIKKGSYNKGEVVDYVVTYMLIMGGGGANKTESVNDGHGWEIRKSHILCVVFCAISVLTST